MKRRIAIILIALAAMLVIGAFVAIRLSEGTYASMPVYQGKNSKQWLDEVFTTNQTAALAAFRVMGTNSFPTLVRALSDTRWDQFYEKMYPRMPASLKKRLSQPPSQTTWSAAELVLLNIGNAREAVPELAGLLSHKSNRARKYIIGTLTSRVEPGDARFVPIFTDCLNDPDSNIRQTAGNILARIGPVARSALPALAAALKDPAAPVRLMAAMAICQIEKTNQEQRDAAIAVVKSEATQTGSYAALYLSVVAHDDPMVVPSLINLLQRSDGGMRAGALNCLGSYGRSASNAVPAIVELIEKGGVDPGTRDQAVRALKSIDPDAAKKYEMGGNGQEY